MAGRFKVGTKLVAGVGLNDGTYPAVKTKEHDLWRSMLARSYTDRNLKLKPAYVGCTVSDNFKNYTYFYEWCNSQIGFKKYDENNRMFALDKDLLQKGNKIYSENTCVFVPMEINNLIVKSDSLRGDLPVGVMYDKARDKFQSQMWVNNKRMFLGRFNTAEEAFFKYKESKEQHIKTVANKWKGLIDYKAYEALINYEVEITD